MLKDWTTLLRLPNALVAALAVWLGHACLQAPLDLAKAALGSLALGLLAAAGNVQNDVLDLAADRINRPRRPLPSGRVSRAAAARAAALLYLVSLGAAFAVSPAHGALALGMAVLLFLYNLRLKALPLWGNLAVSLLCALAVYFPEFPGAPGRTAIPALFAFLTTAARELAKDAEDMAGDKAAGWSTFPLRYGPAPTRGAVGALAVATLLLLPVPALALRYHAAYAWLALLGPAPLLIQALGRAWRTFPDWKRLQRGLKWTMLAGMLAILAGVRP